MLLAKIFLHSKNSILGNKIVYFSISIVIVFAHSRNTLLLVKSMVLKAISGPAASVPLDSFLEMQILPPQTTA